MLHFIVIGITDHPSPFFPPEVLEIIKRGKFFSGGKRHHEIVAHLLPEGAKWIDITVPIESVFTHYQSLPPTGGIGEEQVIIVFASGDPLFFGFANTLQREIPHVQLPPDVSPSSRDALPRPAHRLIDGSSVAGV